MPLKVTFIMQSGSQGFSESWIDGANAISDATFTKAQEYLNKRSLCTGVNTLFNYVRVSVVGSPRVVQVRSTHGFAGAAQGRAPNGLANAKPTSDASFTSLLLRCVDSTGGRWKFMYMRGIPDYVVQDNGDYMPPATFSNNLLAFVAQIKTNAWGWRGVSANPPTQPITAIAAQPSGQVLYTTTAALFPVVPVGTKLVVRVRGITGCPNLNGQQTVLVQSTTTALTLRRIPIFPYTGNGFITAPTLGQVLLDTASVERVVRRGSGKLLYVSAGRRRNIVRG